LSALSPVLAGALLTVAPWGWAFLIPIPFGLVALWLVIKVVPGKSHEDTDPIDHAGGVLSAVFIGALVIAINFAALDNQYYTVIVSGVIAVVGGVLFFWRQKTAKFPLFDLTFAKRPTFWVAAAAGIIVFGSLMGAMFVGMQYLQNVLGYNTLIAGLAILPCPVFMVIVAPYSSGMITRWGSRVTLLIGFAFCLIGFAIMLAIWGLSSSYIAIGIAYAFVGVGVGIAGTPSSHALTDSVPVSKVGMASGTGDLQRDLGGAIMQSIMGAILGAGYAASLGHAIAHAPANVQAQITAEMRDALTKSFGSAVDLASKYPEYKTAVIQAARESFLAGANWAYASGIIAAILGAALVWFFFPRREHEKSLYSHWGSE
jgi:DHA2 family multidrug resistance protein-like MFS transporter